MKAAPEKEKFFLSSALNMEAHLLREMKEVYPFFIEKNGQLTTLEFPEHEIMTGGVEFKSDIFSAHQFQLFSKTAHRLLWRVDEFKAKDFPALFNKTKSSRLKTILGTLPAINVKCAASESRLGQEKRIEESFLKGLGKTANPESPVTVFIRVHQNQVQVSLDLSGEHLHFRNYATDKAAAPLRETWASLFFAVMGEGLSLGELQGVSLLDPFAGSGTMLFESALLHQPNWHRSYALTKLSQAPKILHSPDFAKNYKTKFPFLSKKSYGIEKSEEVFGAMQRNSEKVKSLYPQAPERRLFLGDSLKMQRQDLGLEVDEKLWIFTNPPYGDRLNPVFNLRSKSGVESLLQTLKTNYKPAKIGMVLPFEGATFFKREAKSFLEFSNGGLHCVFMVL